MQRTRTALAGATCLAAISLIPPWRRRDRQRARPRVLPAADGRQHGADAHHGSQHFVNGHLTYGFDLDERTVGGQFALGERRAAPARRTCTPPTG